MGEAVDLHRQTWDEEKIDPVAASWSCENLTLNDRDAGFLEQAERLGFEHGRLGTSREAPCEKQGLEAGRALPATLRAALHLAGQLGAAHQTAAESPIHQQAHPIA